MSNANFYKPGTWNAICDSCGFKFKSNQLRKRWDGLMVDEACWETRNPQDFLRSVREYSNELPWARPDVADTYVDNVGVTCDYFSSQGRADYGTADCFTVGSIYPNDGYPFGNTSISGRAVSGLAIPSIP